MASVIFYHTHGCPQCKMIEGMLKQKNIPYTSVEDVGEMKAKGITRTPTLEVDNVKMTGKSIFDWVKEY